MRTASSKEIKQELDLLPDKDLVQIILRLVRFKKENKELLTYLIFHASSEDEYVLAVKNLIDEGFATVNINSNYIAKKNIRKIMRMISRYVKYSGTPGTEVSLWLYFCEGLKNSGLSFSKNSIFNKILQSQIDKIRKVISGLHEDLQYDYLRELTIMEQNK